MKIAVTCIFFIASILDNFFKFVSSIYYKYYSCLEGIKVWINYKIISILVLNTYMLSIVIYSCTHSVVVYFSNILLYISLRDKKYISLKIYIVVLKYW